MTVLLAIEAIERGQAQLDDPVTAQDDLYSDIYGDSSSVYTSIGETMTLESLLYCAMVASSNESCNVIATYIGGSISNFLT
jgi:D-alanyl-D-alanine carboxypeptidase (penicillin-binding protein 5/6)